MCNSKVVEVKGESTTEDIDIVAEALNTLKTRKAPDPGRLRKLVQTPY